MIEKELFPLLALQKVEGIGDVMAKKLLHHFGAAETIFSAKKKQLLSLDGVGETLFKNLQNKDVFIQAEKELDFIKKENIAVSFYKDDDYPERLKHCFDGPLLLFSSG
uniref:helix-hairpin-helix domain-containing protein n=1 Tax=Microcystis aeruginosa TaxID=1126 RepID=UPI000A80FEFA